MSLTEMGIIPDSTCVNVIELRSFDLLGLDAWFHSPWANHHPNCISAVEATRTYISGLLPALLILLPPTSSPSLLETPRPAYPPLFSI
jgi:hypothetical protein